MLQLWIAEIADKATKIPCSAANRGSVQDLNRNDLEKLFCGIISLLVLEASLCPSKNWQRREQLKLGN